MKKTTLITSVFIFMLIFANYVNAIERRRDQYLTEQSYMIIPLPYSLPGMGSGVALIGGMSNIAESNFDVFGFYISGDVSGKIIDMNEFYLIPKTLSLGFNFMDLDAVMMKNYNGRGMVDTDKDEFSYLQLSKVGESRVNATLGFFDKRLEFFWSYGKYTHEISKIRDNEGDVIYEYDNPDESSSEHTSYGIRIDYTDDYLDPRKGVRFYAGNSSSPPDDKDRDPDYYVMDYVFQAYIPFGESSTWAFYFQQSDAFVKKEGVSDPEVILNEQGFGCASYNDCEEAQKRVIDNIVAARKYGTANSLGGDEQLRAYPGGRFSG
ncbi:hypothetical protein KKA14_00635, partial [bacterium]|nr:hypothetical protein [bacterium]